MHLDPRDDGVLVPPWLAKQSHLVLEIGLDLPIPIPDLKVDAHGVFGTLSFDGSGFTCHVPWESVFALTESDGQGVLWPEDLPSELQEEARARMKDNGSSPRTSATSSGGASTDAGDETDALRPDTTGTVPIEAPQRGNRNSEAPAANGGEGAEGKKTKRELPPYLRVIK